MSPLEPAGHSPSATTTCSSALWLLTTARTMAWIGLVQEPVLAASPPPVHHPFIGCSGSHQLPQLGPISAEPKITRNQGRNHPSSHPRPTAALIGFYLHMRQCTSTQTQRRKPGEPRRQAGGRTQPHLHFHGLQLLLSSSRRRHSPHLIMTGHEVAEKPAAGNEVLVSLQELAAPRIRPRKPGEQDANAHGVRSRSN